MAAQQDINTVLTYYHFTNRMSVYTHGNIHIHLASCLRPPDKCNAESRGLRLTGWHEKNKQTKKQHMTMCSGNARINSRLKIKTSKT